MKVWQDSLRRAALNDVSASRHAYLDYAPEFGLLNSNLSSHAPCKRLRKTSLQNSHPTIKRDIN